MSSYNSIPYESLPISYTYLPHLAGLAKLYGLETAAPEACRVLDIGCAEGNNIIPMAFHWPKSEFVGIDLSAVQIEAGLQMIDSLALKNVQLHVKDIADLDTLYEKHEKHEKFDYIILHGVFSWVTHELQQTILSTAKSLLSENGIIYISYNTYPGWHAQMVIRDAMKLYCNQCETPEEEINMIPRSLSYFKKFFKTADHEFSDYYVKRISILEKQSGEYLYHEFLETNNNPLYVTDFISRANSHALQYLSDALLAFDNPLILGQQRNAFLKKIDDRFEKLQYMDFMINQRFRRSLLCHNSQNVRSEFTAEHMVGLAYRGSLASKKSVQLNNEKPCKFYQNHVQNIDPNVFIKLTHPVSKAAVLILSEIFPASIDYMELLKQSCQRVANSGGLSFIKKIDPFYQEFYLLLINDWINTDINTHHIVKIDWNKPITISPLSWRYAKHSRFLPTFLQKAIDVDELGIQALKLLKEGILKQDLLKKITHSDTHTKNPGLHFWNLRKKKREAKQLNLFLEVLNKNGLLEQHDG